MHKECRTDGTKAFDLWAVGENYFRFLDWRTGGTSKQIKLFNFMNCRAVEISGNLEVGQVAWNSLFS